MAVCSGWVGAALLFLFISEEVSSGRVSHWTIQLLKLESGMSIGTQIACHSDKTLIMGTYHHFGSRGASSSSPCPILVWLG